MNVIDAVSTTTAPVSAASALALLLLTASPPAHADDEDPAAEAARAYDRGVAAHERGDNATAAREFARADQLAPNPIALESALKAALLADTPGLAMELAERAEQRKERTLTPLAKKARAQYEDRAGKLALTCPEPNCTAHVDQQPFPIGPPRWIDPGPHTITFHIGPRTAELDVDVTKGPAVTIARPPEPQPPDHPTPTTPPPSGLSPIWFWTATALTGTLTVATIASGIDTAAKHTHFQDNPTQQTQQTGIAAQTRTNALLGLTLASGLATAALGIFAVRWTTPENKNPLTATLAPTHDGARVFFSGRF